MKLFWHKFWCVPVCYDCWSLKLDYFLTDQSGSWRWSSERMAAERSEYTTGKISPGLFVKVVYRFSLLTYKLKPQALTYFILVRADPNDWKACGLNIIKYYILSLKMMMNKYFRNMSLVINIYSNVFLCSIYILHVYSLM